MVHNATISLTIKSNISFAITRNHNADAGKFSSAAPTAPANRNQVVGESELVAQAAQQTVLQPKNSTTLLFSQSKMNRMLFIDE